MECLDIILKSHWNMNTVNATNVNKMYNDLILTVLENGVSKKDRTGTGTISVFDHSVKIDCTKPLFITTKLIPLRTIFGELLWFLSGSNNINDLPKCAKKIWEKDQRNYNHYLGSLGEECTSGYMGKIYGVQWRGSNCVDKVDQIKIILDQIINNPDSRRIIVETWNPYDVNHRLMALPPCHKGFQMYVSNGYLSMKIEQRSADLFLGVPFNIASYYMLLKMLSILTGLKPGTIGFHYGDLHIYNDHKKQIIEVTDNYVHKLLTNNKFGTSEGTVDFPELQQFYEDNHELSNYPALASDRLKILTLSDMVINGYKSYPRIKANQSS